MDRNSLRQRCYIGRVGPSRPRRQNHLGHRHL